MITGRRLELYEFCITGLLVVTEYFNSNNTKNVLSLQKLEQQFLSELEFDVLGGLDKLGDATLGETEIRQNEFAKKKSVEASRIQTELGDPIIEIYLDIANHLQNQYTSPSSQAIYSNPF